MMHPAFHCCFLLGLASLRSHDSLTGRFRNFTRISKPRRNLLAILKECTIILYGLSLKISNTVGSTFPMNMVLGNVEPTVLEIFRLKPYKIIVHSFRIASKFLRGFEIRVKFLKRPVSES